MHGRLSRCVDSTLSKSRSQRREQGSFASVAGLFCTCDLSDLLPGFMRRSYFGLTCRLLQVIEAVEKYPDLTGKDVMLMSKDGEIGTKEADLVDVLLAKSGRPEVNLTKIVCSEECF